MSVSTPRLSELRKQSYNDANIPKNEQIEIARHVQVLEEHLGPGIRAKYTVRAVLEDGAAMTPVVGHLSVWTHAGREHVGSHTESKLYFCPGKFLGKSDCEKLMPEVANATTSHTCPSCGLTWDPELVIGERKGRLTRQGWAAALTDLVNEVGRCVEVVLVIWEKGMRDANRMEMHRNRQGEALTRQRTKKLTANYRYPSLLRDLSRNNNDLGVCMRKLLDSASNLQERR